VARVFNPCRVRPMIEGLVFQRTSHGLKSRAT